MGAFKDYLSNVSQQASQRGKRLYDSKLFRFGLVGTLVSALLFPSALPVLAIASLVAPLVYHGTMAIIKPIPFRFNVRSLFGGINQTSQAIGNSVTRNNTSSNSMNDVVVPKGKKVGDPMTDLLIQKLRDAGLTVTTDWKLSEQFLKTLPDKYSHLKKDSKHVGGFVYEGIVHINPKSKIADVPIHEYTHLWAEVVRQKNPDEWKHIVELMKQEQQLWKDVQRLYPHLKTDDEIADEVLATYSGQRGGEKLRQYFQGGTDAKEALNGVFQALQLFWKNVCGFLHVQFTDKDEIADAVLSDLLKGEKLMEHIDKSKQTLSDKIPLGSLDKQIEKVKDMNDDYHIKVLTGDEARKAVKDILSQGVEEKNSVYYPYLIGTTGYFEDKNAKGEKIFSAFDNTTGDCWCEDFMTEEGAKQYCTTQVSAEDIHKSEVIKQIEDILAPYMQSGDHDTFFRMTLDVGEPRLTLGLLMDNRGTRHHVMVYPKENITGNGMRFSTNLSKDLSALPLERLKSYVNNLSDLKETNQLMPAVIREVIDDELSADEDVFMGVIFDKPYDEEQQAIGDRYGCETMDQQTNECILPDFDAAINYAYDNTRVLLRRGDHYREVGTDGAITFHVTQESADKNLVDLARKHGGDADMSHIGNPLVMAYFSNLKDAKAYRDEAKSLLLSNKTQIQSPEYKVVNNVDTIVLSKDSFAALYDEYRTRHDFNDGYPPYVKFDENGQFELEMEFHDGYARDLNPHGLGMYDRVGLYYPTVREVEDSPTMQGEIERLTNRKWSEGSGFEKIFDIALRYGEASRVRCPNARYVDAVDAIVQRTNSISAKSFTPEQRERIQLAAACNGEDAYTGDFREVFYEHLLHAANEKMPGVNKHWLQDTSEELKDLAHDKAWEHAVGIRR